MGPQHIALKIIDRAVMPIFEECLAALAAAKEELTGEIANISIEEKHRVLDWTRAVEEDL